MYSKNLSCWLMEKHPIVWGFNIKFNMLILNTLDYTQVSDIVQWINCVSLEQLFYQILTRRVVGNLWPHKDVGFGF